MDGISVGNSIRKMVIGNLIAEYGALELKDEVKHDLKQRVNAVIRSSNHVQDYFRHRHDATPEVRAVFEKTFKKSEYYLLTEILVELWDLNDDDLEMVLNSIKENKQSQLAKSDEGDQENS